MIVKQGGNGEVFIDVKPIQQARFIDGSLRATIMREGEHGLRFIPPADKVNLALTCSSIAPLDMNVDNTRVLSDMQATNTALVEQNNHSQQALANLTAQIDALKAQIAGGKP